VLIDRGSIAKLSVEVISPGKNSAVLHRQGMPGPRGDGTYGAGQSRGRHWHVAVTGGPKPQLAIPVKAPILDRISPNHRPQRPDSGKRSATDPKNGLGPPFSPFHEFSDGTLYQIKRADVAPPTISADLKPVEAAFSAFFHTAKS
jgi:hypothetical protein